MFSNEDWIDSPYEVKTKFFNHFSNRFSTPTNSRFHVNFEFPKQLPVDKVFFLEEDGSYNEVKREVWDYGGDKSLGLDGFTFDFFKKY